MKNLLGFVEGDIIELDNIDIIHESGVDKISLYIKKTFTLKNNNKDVTCYFCENKDDYILVTISDDVKFYYCEFESDEENPFVDDGELVDNIQQNVEFDDSEEAVIEWKSKEVEQFNHYSMREFTSDCDKYNYKHALSLLHYSETVEFYVGNVIKPFEINIYKNEKL